MKYSIIIPIYVKPEFNNIVDQFIIPCLDSVVKYTDFGNTEVILILNQYTDYIYNKLNKYIQENDFKLFVCKNGLGFPKAINTGVRLSEGEYVVFLNDDCILLSQEKNEWLYKLTLPFKNDEKMAVTGVHELFNEEIQDSFVVGYCFMTKRDLLEKFGLLDEIFSPGSCEDIDYCLKIKGAGYKICAVGPPHGKSDNLYTGSFPIYHKGEGTFDFISNTKERGDKNINILKQRKESGFYAQKVENLS